MVSTKFCMKFHLESVHSYTNFNNSKFAKVTLIRENFQKIQNHK